MPPSAEIIHCISSNWPNSEIMETLESHQNQVFAGRIQNRPAIFRCTTNSRRSLAQIHHELNWMDFLRDHGTRVPTIQLSALQHSVESVNVDGSTIHVVAFQRLGGMPLSSERTLTVNIAEQWGRLIGKMNQVSLEFHASQPFRWHGDKTGIMALGQYIHALGDAPSVLSESLTVIESRPKNPSTYGLIHCDCHADNVYLWKDDLYALDFDECCFHWRMMDIANAIFSFYFDFASENRDLNAFAPLSRAILHGFVDAFPAIMTEMPLLPHFLNYRLGLLLAWSSGLSPAPQWMASATEEWKAFLRQWSKDEIQSGRVASLIS